MFNLSHFQISVLTTLQSAPHCQQFLKFVLKAIFNLIFGALQRSWVFIWDRCLSKLVTQHIPYKIPCTHTICFFC